MNPLLRLVLFGLGCTLVAGQTVPGGFSPVGPGDEADVNQCRTKIITDIQTRESSTNSGYKVAVATTEEKVESQVVSGKNYRFTFKATISFSCAANSNCLPKDSKTQSCTATVYKSLDATQSLTYVPNQELTCQ